MSIPLDRSRLQAEGSASSHVRSSDASPSQTTVDSLTDDLLVEILSRVPAKSICRFKCVSKHWLSLIHDRNHRKKMPQTLEGFFYGANKNMSFLESPVGFTTMSGSRRPLLDFTFLPDNRRIDLLDCCNGLLLCHWYGISGSDDEFCYVVCNPVTEKWHALPDYGQDGKVGTARLGFDLAVSSHFHVFVLLEDGDNYLTGVHVYSSESGRWINKEKGLDQDISLRNSGSPAVFLNGYLHFCIFDEDRCYWSVAAVHTGGETWMSFEGPYCVLHGFIQQSQGRLHYVGFAPNDYYVYDLIVVYVLEDYDSKEWVLKHKVDSAYIGWPEFHSFHWVAIHPEWNLIFFTMGQHITLMCYNMDHRQTKEVRYLGDGRPPYLPYVPLHAELHSLNM